MNNFAAQVKNLTVKFGKFTAVDNITFDVKKGEIFGFLGANGAGKTTTIRVLCGLLIPTGGQVSISDTEVKYKSGHIIKNKIGYMSQKFTLYHDLTVEENLKFISALHKVDHKSYLDRQKELLDFIAFDRDLDTKVSELSTGTKQYVSLVASLLHNPDLIFLDEPTAGVTPASRALFWKLIQKIIDQKKTVFVTTHYLDEAEQCHRIALMREGKIVALDTPEELKKKAFSEPIYEFDSKEKKSFSELESYKNDSDFSFFASYGARFHASTHSKEEWHKVQSKYSGQFNIKEISPSLEDVFIKIVEGKS